MGSIVRTQDGTCTNTLVVDSSKPISEWEFTTCDKPVEYIGVLVFGDSDCFDLCADCYLRFAFSNLQWLLFGKGDGDEVATMKQYLDHVLLDTGWGGRRVDPGWPTREQDMAEADKAVAAMTDEAWADEMWAKRAATPCPTCHTVHDDYFCPPKGEPVDIPPSDGKPLTDEEMYWRDFRSNLLGEEFNV